MKQMLLSLALTAICVFSAAAEQTITVSVTNPSSQPRTDAPVVISLSAYGDVQSALVTTEGVEIPCQLDDLNQDEQFDELCFLADLDKKETRLYTITLSDEGLPRTYPARVFAEMVMSNTKDKSLKKNQQNNFIESITARGDAAYTYNLLHHHGVDFESELNGIRIYFDARQTLDLYGKFNKGLELRETQFYTDAEQKKRGYGDDVLWVGQTFGLGAFRGWDGEKPTLVEPVRTRTQRVVSYGPLRTIVELVDRGWKADADKPAINMTLRYTQYAGHRDTDVDVYFNRDVTDYRFSTGIINVKQSVGFSDKKGLRACWGTDYPAADTTKWKPETVGLAVCIPQRYIVSEEPVNKDNYPYVLQIRGTHMNYKVTYTSANETFGYPDAEAWFAYLREWKKEVVEKPVIVKF